MLQESLENLRVLLTKLPAMVNATTVCIEPKGFLCAYKFVLATSLYLLTHHKF